MSTCAHCTEKYCITGDLTKAPKNCPTVMTETEKEMSRYSNEDRRTAKAAALVEAGGYGRLTRVEEIMEYAIRCGYNHIGVGFCVGLSQEALIFVKILKSNGFQVDSVCCKIGSVPKSELGLTREDYVESNCEFEIMCNPAGQAAVLDEAGCQLNVVCGLCVGHDTLFIKNSKAPVTVLAAKDRVTGHNPLAPIYNAASYRSNLYNYVERRKEELKNYLRTL